MGHKGRLIWLAGLSVVVLVLLTGGAVAVVRHSHADRQRQDLATARRFAVTVMVGDAHRSHGCKEGGISCWSTSLSVQAITRSVAASLHDVSGRDPRVRCFLHRIGVLDSGTVVDSCNVDVRVGAHTTFAFINPVMTGPLRDGRAIGATVSINAD
jgi:hypothetical protein